MSNCIIHYGSSVFKQFENVEFREDTGKHITGSRIFNNLCVDGKSVPVSKVFLGWSCAIFLAEGKLYCCGFKDEAYSTCGISHHIIKDKIVKVTCGWNEMFIVTEYGGCYLCEANSWNLIKVDVASVKARDVATGDKYSILLTDCGKVFAINHTDISVMLSPIKLQNAVTAVACGKEFVLLLSLEGQIFTYGIGSRGQLGHGDTDSRDSPTLVEALDGIKIKSVAAGGWHAAVVSDIGDLYLWGWNESGQLGLPCAANSKQKSEEIVVVQSIPRLLEFNPEITITAVGCGSRHTAVLTDAGAVLTWGWNGYEQLGNYAQTFSDVPVPLELPHGFHASSITCLYWSTLITGKYSKPQ